MDMKLPCFLFLILFLPSVALAYCDGEDCDIEGMGAIKIKVFIGDVAVTHDATITLWQNDGSRIPGTGVANSLSMGSEGYTEEIAVPANTALYTWVRDLPLGHIDYKSDDIVVLEGESKSLEIFLERGQAWDEPDYFEGYAPQDGTGEVPRNSYLNLQIVDYETGLPIVARVSVHDSRNIAVISQMLAGHGEFDLQPGETYFVTAVAEEYRDYRSDAFFAEEGGATKIIIEMMKTGDEPRHGAVCGDGICDLGEVISCPEDCSPLRIEGMYTEPERIKSGEGFDLHLWIMNSGRQSFSGELKASAYIDNELLGSVVRPFVIRSGKQEKLVLEKFRTDLPPGSYILSIQLEYAAFGREYNNRFDLKLNIVEPVEILSGGETILRDGDNSPEYPLPISKDNGLGALYVIAILVAAGLAMAFVVVYIQKKKRVRPVAGPTISSELSELYKKKEELEEMIKIAKVKFYKRVLDEESYKEIVKENQGRLIEIEAKIGEIEKRVKILEEIQSKEGKK
jgi:hypothetical protein